jgi:hypothetical protein
MLGHERHSQPYPRVLEVEQKVQFQLYHMLSLTLHTKRNGCVNIPPNACAVAESQQQHVPALAFKTLQHRQAQNLLCGSMMT